MVQNRIKELRKKNRLTLEELAAAVGTSKQTVQRYETGVISNIPPERVIALATALNTTPSTLMGWSEGNAAGSHRALPMLGEISCGEPIYIISEHDNYVAANSDLGADFCLRAHGDSMVGARIYDGDIVFIRRQDYVENGEIAAVAIDDEATLKRVYYYPDESKIILMPENPKYAPIVYINEELQSVKILGKAVAFQSTVV